MVQAVAFSSVLPRWKSYTQSNSPSRYYVLEKILIPIVLYANRGDGDFFFLSIENIVGRRNASPLGVPADLKSADKKGSTYLMRICNPPQARMLHQDIGDMKSLRLRIANPR